MIVAYDGTRYHGWQRQKLTDCTIQQILEDTLERLVGYHADIQGSGRTDAGVHAKGQCASMQLAGKVADDFVHRWNELLPEDIRIMAMTLVRAGFHARYRAVGKRYLYRVDTRDIASVFMRRYACHYAKQLDIDAMKKAAEYLTGTHDFTAFTDDKTDKSKVRTIYAIDIRTEGSMIDLSFYGTGFLYHMVRILTGTLLCVGEGRMRSYDVKKALEQRDRSLAGFVAPASGLCLEKVYYEEKDV